MNHSDEITLPRVTLRRRWLRMTRLIRHPKFLAWSIENRWKGYKFGPIKRCRTCDHTTPYHYDGCKRGAE